LQGEEVEEMGSTMRALKSWFLVVRAWTALRPRNLLFTCGKMT